MQPMIVSAKQVYGQSLIYPVCGVAKAYAEALGTKTLTRQALECAKRMGFSIQIDAAVCVADLLASAA